MPEKGSNEETVTQSKPKQMITSTVEFVADEIELGVAITTTEGETTFLHFWVPSQISKTKLNRQTFTAEDFQENLVPYFKKICAESDTHVASMQFDKMAADLTGHTKALSTTEVEEFRDLMDSIVAVLQAVRRKTIPWYE